MLRIAWVAAIAMLLGAVNPSIAQAEESGTKTATSEKADEAKADGATTDTPVKADEAKTDGATTDTPVKADEAKADGASDGKVVKTRNDGSAEADDVPPVAPKPPPALDKPVTGQHLVDFLRRSDKTYATKDEVEAALGSKVSQADFDAAIAKLSTKYKQNSNWQGFHFGTMVTFAGAVATGAEGGMFGSRVDALIRQLSPHHVGWEAAAGGGCWVTEGANKKRCPYMFTTSVAFAAGGSHWAASVGPEYSVLQHLFKGHGVAHLVNLKFAGEYRPDKNEHLMIRVFLSPNLYNEGTRTGGLHIGGSVGAHF